MTDTGIGIPADRLDRLFQSFSQVDPTTTRRYGGTGLGLAISRRITELMGGHIKVESEPGRGTTFAFTIPVLAGTLPGVEEPHRATLAGRRVLIVERHDATRRALERQLAAWDLVAASTASPTEAQRWIREGQAFDAVLVDLLERTNGGWLASAVRGMTAAAAPVFIGLTSLARREEADGSAFAGFLIKPVKASRLFDALAEPQLAASHPLRILIAEDNRVNQMVASLMLGKLGYKADVVANGREAIEAVRRVPYDLVFMDLQMPEIDGLEAARRIVEEYPPVTAPVSSR